MKQTKRKSAATAATVNGANPKLHFQDSTDSKKMQELTGYFARIRKTGKRRGFLI